MIDGLLFLVIWSIFGMASATYWHGALPIIAFILLPVSAFVSWRGAKSVERIKNGTATNKTSATEGSVCGLIVTLSISIWSYATQVQAAGTVFDNVSLDSLEFYKRIIEAYLPLIIGGTFVGALHGIAFFNLNKRLVKTIK